MLFITNFIYLLSFFSIIKGKIIQNLRKTQTENPTNQQKYNIDIPKPATIPSFIKITSEDDIEKVEKIEFIYNNDEITEKTICFSKINETDCELFTIEGDDEKYLNITILNINGTYKLNKIIDSEGPIVYSNYSYYLRTFKGNNNLFFFKKDSEIKKAFIIFDFFEEEVLNKTDVQFSTPDNLTSSCNKNQNLLICECIFNVNSYETYFASINYGDPLFSTHIAYTIFTFIYDMKEGITCTDNGQILSLIIESDIKLGYNFDILLSNKDQNHTFKTSTSSDGNEIAYFNINEQFIADKINVYLNDKLLKIIEDYKLEIYPDKFISVSKTIIPMDNIQTIILTYSRPLKQNEFEKVIFYKDKNNNETLMFPRTNGTNLICLVDFNYLDLEEGEYKILYYHKCNNLTDSKLSVFFGNLDVIKINPPYYKINLDNDTKYEIILLGAIEGSKLLLINDDEEKLDEVPYELTQLEKEFHYEFTIPKRMKIPKYGKYYFYLINDGQLIKSQKNIIVYGKEVELNENSKFIIFNKTLENPLYIILKEEIIPEQIVSINYENTELSFDIQTKAIIINTTELIEQMEDEKIYPINIKLINDNTLIYYIEYYSFELINNKEFYDISKSHQIDLPIQIYIKYPEKYLTNFYISESDKKREKLNCEKKDNIHSYNIECKHNIQSVTNNIYFIEFKDGEEYYSKRNLLLSLFTISEGKCHTETTEILSVKAFTFDSNIKIFVYSPLKNYELIKDEESGFFKGENIIEGEYILKVRLNDLEIYEITNSNIKIIKKYTSNKYSLTIEKTQPSYKVEFEENIEITELIFKKKIDKSYMINSQSCRINDDNKKELICNFNFNGKDSGEYNLYYKDQCDKDVEISNNNNPILITEKNNKYKLNEIKPESISLPMTSPQVLNLIFDQKFRENEYIVKIIFFNEKDGELEYSFNVTYSDNIVTVENFQIKEPIKGEYKIKFIFNNGDFGISEKKITFLSVNFEFSRFNIILNNKSQILFVKVLGIEKEKVTKLFIKDVNSEDVNYKEGNKTGDTYSFIIDTIGNKQLSYFRNDTGSNYNIIGRVIKVYNTVDDFITFEKINQCFYKFENSKNIIFNPKLKTTDSEELGSILQNINVYILNEVSFKKQFQFNKIDNSYTLSSQDIKDINFGEFYIKMIENEDFDNPIFEQKIILSDLKYYSNYTDDNIIFNNVICEFDNIYLIQKQDKSEKKKLNCNFLKEEIYKCEYPFSKEILDNNENYVIEQDNNKLGETNIIPSFSNSEFTIKLDGKIKVGEKNKILLIPTFFHMNYLENIRIKTSDDNIIIFKKENQEETSQNNTFKIENNYAIFELKIESGISYKITELKRIQFDSDLSIELTQKYVNISINDNPDVEINITQITGKIYEYSSEQKLTIVFNKNINPEEISNIIINNITNSKEKIFPEPKCTQNTEISILCKFDLSLIQNGIYYLKFFEYKNKEYSSNINIEVLKEIIGQCDKGYILIKKKCILPDFSNDIESNKCNDNYCGNNGKCIENGLIPNCKCNSGYSGLFCDIEEKNIENHFNELKNKFENYDISQLEENPLLIKELNYYINNPGKISDDLKENLNEIIINKLTKIEEDTFVNSENYYLLINLFMTVALKKNQKVTITKRILKEEDNVFQKIISLSKNIAKFNFLNDIPPDSIKYFSTDSSLINYIFFTNHEDSLKKLNQLSKKIKDLSTINTNNCSSSKFTSSKKAEILISQIIFSKDISFYLSSNSNQEYISELLTISAFPYKENNLILNNNIISECKNLILNMKIYGNINLDLLNKYSQCSDKGINIYDINDPAFNDQCFFCVNGTDYDLPIIYNRENIYQKNKISKTSNSINCNFQNIDSTNQKLIISCTSITDKISNDGFSYEIKKSNNEFKNKNDFYHNGKIPFKCPGYVTKLHKNYAFWFYLIILLLLIGVFILFYYIKHYLLAIKNDKLGLEIKQSTELQDKSEKSKEIKEKNDTDSQSSNSSNTNSHVSENEEEKDFLEYFFKNIIKLHPLISPFLPSLIGNQMITSLIFLFSLITTFGFNSLYFTEKMLEKRIEKESRNSFFYPLQNSFHRIFFSIISMMLINAIIRLICVVTKEQWNELDNLIRGSKDDEAKLNEADHFENDMKIRRLISVIVIFVITIFFFYYCVIFFSIYKKAQIDWFYSGIWSMIFNWVLFSNLYIALITFIETDGLSNIAYYMKRIFPF